MNRAAYVVWNAATHQLEVRVPLKDGSADVVLAVLAATAPPDDTTDE